MISHFSTSLVFLFLIKFSDETAEYNNKFFFIKQQATNRKLLSNEVENMDVMSINTSIPHFSIFSIIF